MKNKKAKLTLKDLNVQSFITESAIEKGETIKGGDPGNGNQSLTPVCNTGVPACRNSEANVCNPLYTIGILPDTDMLLMAASPIGEPYLCV